MGGLVDASNAWADPELIYRKIVEYLRYGVRPPLNPDEILSRDALAVPHRTVIDPERRKRDVLNQALKEAILREL